MTEEEIQYVADSAKDIVSKTNKSKIVASVAGGRQ